MKRGNPYHDDLGRFTTPYGAYNAKADDDNIRRTTESYVESWQDDFSEIDRDECTDDWGAQSDDAWEETMEEERREKYDEFHDEVAEIYTQYNTEMRARMSKMSANELYEWYAGKHDSDIREKLDKEHPEFEGVADSAAEDFDIDVADYRYRRIVSRTNGHQKLFAMAEREDGTFNGYATERVKALGLEKEYEDYKVASEAYERGDMACGKPASAYKNKKSYVMAKMKYYAQVDQENHAKMQFEKIQASNPMRDDVHTGIRSVDDIKSFKQAMTDSGFFKDNATPDFTVKDAKAAQKSGFITIYSSKPIEMGAFVTPSKMEAESYAGGGQVYSQKVKIEDVAWIDGIEGQYAALN